VTDRTQRRENECRERERRKEREEAGKTPVEGGRKRREGGRGERWRRERMKFINKHQTHFCTSEVLLALVLSVFPSSEEEVIRIQLYYRGTQVKPGRVTQA
jgi:hypothetical protein